LRRAVKKVTLGGHEPARQANRVHGGGTGLAVIVGLGILHRQAVCDHVAAWHFQLTKETQTIEPEPPKDLPRIWSARFYLAYLAYNSEQPVILGTDSAYDDLIILPSVDGEVTVEKRFEANGWRVIEQRFPAEGIRCNT
jgi:hypothetical protein